MQDWRLKLREMRIEAEETMHVKVEPVVIKKPQRLSAVTCYKDSRGLHLIKIERRELNEYA